VQRNRFSGPLPGSLLSLPSLVLLDVSSNRLSGLFPSVFIANAGMVRATDNAFSGPLPVPFDVQHVFYLDLAANDFSGVVPDYSSDGAFLLNAPGNPQLRQPCAVVLPAQASACLPPLGFLALQPSTPETVASRSMVCPALVARHAEQVATVDVSYLGYAQCYCLAGFFQPNSTDRQCIPCDDSCQCVYGRTSGCYPTPFAGPWQRAISCPPIGTGLTACNPNGTLGDPAAPLFVCEEGYGDRLCSRCDDGFYQDGFACVRCAPYLVWLLPLLYCAFVCLLSAYFLLVRRPCLDSMGFSQSCAQVPPAATGIVRILVFYVQTAIVLVRSAGRVWPAGASVALGQLSALASFVIDAVSCIFPDSSTRSHLGGFFIMPLGLLALTAAIYVVGVTVRALQSRAAGLGFVLDWGFAGPAALRAADEPLYERFLTHEVSVAPAMAEQGRAWRRRCVYTGLAFLNMVYFGVTERVAGALACTLYDPGEARWYLAPYPWIRCDMANPEFVGIVGFAVPAALVYVLGIPALFLGLLLRNGHQLSDRDNEATLGFLYGCFKPRFYAWEAVLIVRRVCLAAVIRLFPFTTPQAAALAVLLILNVSLLLQHVCRPHRTVIENALELTSLYVLLVSFLAATIAPTSQALLVCVLVLNLVAVLVLLVFAALVFTAAAAQRLGRLASSRNRVVRVARALHDRLMQHDGLDEL
jgi:hypothetical protein